MNRAQTLAALAMLASFAAWCGYHGKYIPDQLAAAAASRHADQLDMFTPYRSETQHLRNRNESP